MELNFGALILGAVSFLVIGIFHPIVIKAEYYLGKGCWPLFLLAGLGFSAAALFVQNMFWGVTLALVGFSCFWSIKELFEQERRVQRGWFPANHRKGRR